MVEFCKTFLLFAKINFKILVIHHACFFLQGTQAVAVVMSRDRPHLSFALTLVSSEQTFDYPQQSWRFQSQYALRDYTGVYFIKLIPCTADEVGLKIFEMKFDMFIIWELPYVRKIKNDVCLSCERQKF